MNKTHNFSPSNSESYFAVLNQVGLIEFSGEERESYLQGQVTCDVVNCPINQWIFGAHCDAKGKVFSVFRLVKTDSKIFLITTLESAKQSIEQFKKFAVFSKTEIQLLANTSIYISAPKDLVKKGLDYYALPDANFASDEQNNLLLNLGKDWLLFAEKTNLDKLINTGLQQVDELAWTYRELINGIPQLHGESINQFVPQMLNVQAIEGISFTKGCYIGQETVARMQYLGKNKRALYTLKTKTSAKVCIGDVIESNLSENWRRAGQIMDVYQDSDELTIVQVVMASEIEAGTLFRLKNNDSVALEFLPLPYSLN